MSDRFEETGVQGQMAILHGEVRRQRGEIERTHERVNEHGNCLVVLMGPDRRNGWKSLTDKRLDSMERRQDEQGEAMKQMQISAAKQALINAAATFVAAAVAMAVIEYVMGGG